MEMAKFKKTISLRLFALPNEELYKQGTVPLEKLSESLRLAWNK